jgi:hypothetical protein
MRGGPLPSTYLDRKQQSQRLRLVAGLPVRLNRVDGTLIDIGRGGARVRHSGALKVGTEMTFTFTSGTEKFTATARVISCRVVGLGQGERGQTLFETSLRYAQVPPESMMIIEQMMTSAPLAPAAP